MNKKQRAALTALRDVMKEHDIDISIDNWREIEFDVEDGMPAICIGDWRVSHGHLTKLLEQEAE